MENSLIPNDYMIIGKRKKKILSQFYLYYGKWNQGFSTAEDKTRERESRERGAPTKYQERIYMTR